MKKQRIIVGMSGGVDSSVAALLLKRQGHDVVGLFMKNWEEESEGGVCTAEQDYADVRRVCAALGIDYYTVNFSKEYKERVFSKFLSEYNKGRTPNPDVLCNREIKFGPFLDHAKAAGADLIATGHYAGTSPCACGGTRLVCAADEDKDQTYFLHQLTQPQLKSVTFPLERLTKREVRQIAAQNNLITAQKRDSTGICFIGERDFTAFLKTYLPAQSGDIVTENGTVVGKHDGLMFYTLGQRRGIGLGGVAGSGDGRWFVIGKDLEHNRLIVSHGDESALFSGGCSVCGINLICFEPKIGEPTELSVRLRHRQKLQVATAVFDGVGGARVTFARAQRAVTAGQYCVFYQNGVCLGGGVID